MSKQITIEMPDNIDCLIIAFLQSVSYGTVNIGQKVIAHDEIADGAKATIYTSENEGGDTE